MTTSDEVMYVLNSVPSSVKILIDVGHLNVSARTLQLNPLEELLRLQPFASAYHVSENNGLQDQNLPIYSDSWFVPYINKNAFFMTLEVYRESPQTLYSQLMLLRELVH